jgi:hypothetical protein
MPTRNGAGQSAFLQSRIKPLINTQLQLGVRREVELNRFSRFGDAKPLKRFSDPSLLSTQLKLGVNENSDRLLKSEMQLSKFACASANLVDAAKMIAHRTAK